MTTIATHLIKIKGTFDKKIWGYEKEILNEKLKEFVNKKIKEEIDDIYHTDLELFQINDNIIDVWVYIRAYPYNISKDIIEKWLKDHIKEEGITIIDFDYEERTNLRSSEKDFFVVIP